MKKKIISILFVCFFSIFILTSCENPPLDRREPLTSYITSFEDYYKYTILDSDKYIYYPNEEQSNRLEEALNKFLSVDVVANKDFKEENALKHFYVCLVLSNDEYDLFFMYNASPDGDASISIYDNKTFTYYTVDDYQAELNLGVAICSVKDELKKEGFCVNENKPYRGGYITRHYNEKFKNVETLQIELRYRAYIDNREFGEEYQPKINEDIFYYTKEKMKRVFETLVNYYCNIVWLYVDEHMKL